MKNSHLTQRALARRWHLSPRTLERWRWEGFGPAHLKIGGRVLYRIEDVQAYERKSLLQETRKDMGVVLGRAS